MPAVTLAASLPGAHFKHELVVGNPDVAVQIDAGDLPSGVWSPTPELTVSSAGRERLLVVTADRDIELLTILEGETTASPTGDPVYIPTNSGGLTSYACVLRAGTTGVFVREP